MLTEYIQAALDRAEYEMIDDTDPFYGEVAGLDGVFQGSSITALVVFLACSRTKLSSLAPGTQASLCSLTLAPELELLVSSSGISSKK